MERPETEYVRSGDVYLAYQTFGEGRDAVVVVHGRLSNVELVWDDPDAEVFLRGLAGFARVAFFDKRGVGASERVAGVPTLEQQVEDVRTVMDVANFDRAFLFGTRDGAALACLFAATVPTRVSGLMLWQPIVKGAKAPDYPWGSKADEIFPYEGSKFAGPEYIQEGMRLQFPDRIDDAAARRRYARYLRLSAGPTVIAAQARMWFESDVRGALPAVQVPALVMHGGVGNVDESRYVADRLPVARFVEFPELRAVSPFWGDSRAVVETMREFVDEVGEASPIDEPTRVLATVLFTDLVGSTERAIELGPRWRETLGQHNTAIRRELMRFRGREIDTAGDGFFASGFDGPARAIRCARAIRDTLQALDLQVRIGIHTGECDLVDGKLAGVAVAIGARVAAKATAGEVLVSATVRDLVAGSGIAFDQRGLHDLRGIGEMELFAVSPQ